MPYLVDVVCEDYDNHNHYCDTYEEAVEYAEKQKDLYCGIYKLVATKDEFERFVEEDGSE